MLELKYHITNLKGLVNQTEIEDLYNTFKQTMFRDMVKDLLDAKCGRRDFVIPFEEQSDENIYRILAWEVTTVDNVLIKTIFLTQFFEWWENHPEWPSNC